MQPVHDAAKLQQSSCPLANNSTLEHPPRSICKHWQKACCCLAVNGQLAGISAGQASLSAVCVTVRTHYPNLRQDFGS